MNAKSITLSFRLSAAQMELVDRACIPLGISRGEWAKGVVVAHLVEQSSRSQLDEKITSIAAMVEDAASKIDDLVQQTERIHQNLGRSLLIALTHEPPVAVSDARSIVRENLLP